MSGSLPIELARLGSLKVLRAWDTDLCALPDPDFQAWLERVPVRRIVTCGIAWSSRAYLTQAVQIREYPRVPLVADERALLRVFVTASVTTSVGIPRVLARFYHDGTEKHVADIPATGTAIPTEVDEGDLSLSANALIPGVIVRPGIEMVIEIDPDSTLDPGLGVPRRIPETGRLPVDVRKVPVLDLTVVPFLWSTDPDSVILDLTAAMAADPKGHGLLWHTRTLLPVGDLHVTAHEAVLSSSNSAWSLINQTRAIRVLEGGTGHYMGMTSGAVTGGVAGLATLGGRVSFSIPDSDVMAHELGHNMNLRHAPCGNPGGLDRWFPYRDGSIGVWGYDFHEGGRLVEPRRPDLMSYCGPGWISDYHFTRALQFRQSSDRRASSATGIVELTRSLLLWGGIDAEGHPVLNPAFVVDARPALPGAIGDHRITGRDADGQELFSLRFTMSEVADGDGQSSFAFVLPVRAAWADALASITLSGPGGSVTLDGDSDQPMTILRDSLTGQVRGILRDLSESAMGRAAREPNLRVLFSRGIPEAAAWRR